MRLEHDLKEAYENVISVFYDISKDMTSTFDEREIVDIALSLMKKVIDYEAVSFLKFSALFFSFSIEYMCFVFFNLLIFKYLISHIFKISSI